MPFQKVEFTFPEPDEDGASAEDDTEIEVEPSSAVDVEVPSASPVQKEPDTTDEIEVEVVDDVPKKDRNRSVSEPPEEVTDEELEDYSDKVRKRIKHFSKGYHDERRAKEQALREREELERYAQKLVEENKGLKSSVNKNNTEQPAPAPVDDLAQEWAKTNTWFGQDDEMTSLALGLHTKLVKQGVDPTSDDYYDAIDSRMQQVFPDKFEDVDRPNRRPTKRQANVVAPATRSTSPKKVRLTQTQVNLANRLGVSLKDYAEQVAIEMRKADG
jgi:hypothetical protein